MNHSQGYTVSTGHISLLGFHAYIAMKCPVTAECFSKMSGSMVYLFLQNWSNLACGGPTLAAHDMQDGRGGGRTLRGEDLP